MATDLVTPKFYIKRLHRDTDDCNTVDRRPFDFLVCVGEPEAYSYPLDDEGHFPPLVETRHAPVLDISLAKLFQRDNSYPHAAQMLYVCLRCPEKELGRYKLCVSMIFEEESPDPAEFLQGKTRKLELPPYEFPFKKDRKTPPAEDKYARENRDHDCYYLRFLFVSGNHPDVTELKFGDTIVFDVGDDSQQGFPPTCTLWLSGQDPETNFSKKLEKQTGQELLFVETMPNLIMHNDPSTDVYEQLGSNEDEEEKPLLEW